MRNTSGFRMVARVLILILVLALPFAITASPRFPDYETWCSFLYEPEELMVLPIGYPKHISSADMDGDGEVEILITTVISNPATGDWESKLLRIVDPLPVGAGRSNQIASYDGKTTDWGLTGNQQGFVSQIAVDDINRDGLDDIAVVFQKATSNRDIFDSKLILVFGSSNEEFQLVEFPLELGSFASGHILLSDINSDAKLEVVIPDPLKHRFWIFWGFADEGFAEKTLREMSEIGYMPLSILSAEMDGDSILDLVISGFSFQESGNLRRFVQIGYGNGDGTFKFGSPMLVGWEEPTLLGISTQVADFDGNGLLDVLSTIRSDLRDGISASTTGFPSGESLLILSQVEVGVFFDIEPSWVSESGPTSIEWISINDSDFRVIVHVPGAGLRLFESFSDTFTRECPIPQSSSVLSLLVDLDNDGWLEAVMAERTRSNVVTLWLSDPSHGTTEQ